MNNIQIDQLIINALIEDSDHGDATSERIFTADHKSTGRFIAKEAGVIAGCSVATRVFELLGADIQLDWQVVDGDVVSQYDVLGTITGQTLAILKGERIALNLMQRMSGIATLTAAYVKEIEDLPCRLVDTRKTTPGLRLIEKYAVTVGGGYNHRYNLSDAVMIKDNHVKAAGGIALAVAKIKKTCPHTMKIEVEVESLDQMEEAIVAGADIVMLDNMRVEDMAEAVRRNAGRVVLEASGNVSLETIRMIAKTGVDVISCGKLTHSVSAFDISLKF
ncbi:MAG: carboxylating nicotinate-nucleotide diphosphorylase [Clostridia bacterium]|nr:carboxylating nicotinate-nucleotide diphosphorylase [Clostridia bacterium]